MIYTINWLNKALKRKSEFKDAHISSIYCKACIAFLFNTKRILNQRFTPFDVP